MSKGEGKIQICERMSSGERGSDATDSSALAENRTDLAEDRTLLASERTFAGWSRTSLASIGVGLGFQALFRQSEPTWAAKAIATVFVLLGIVIIWNAERRAAHLLGRMSPNSVKAMGKTRFRGIAIVLSTGGLLTLGAIWFLI